jgi:hypothetical protein
MMKNKNELLSRIEKLTDDLININQVKDELWMYHPSNPNFINPISSFEKVKLVIKDIECEIDDLNQQLLTLN